MSGTDYSAAFLTALVNAVDATEPEIKTQIVNACDPIVKYLFTQTQTLDLKSTLRQTVFSDVTGSDVLSNFDYTVMTKNIMQGYICGPPPEGIIFSDTEINTMTAALQPSIKIAFAGAAGDFADYLTGTDVNFSIGVPLQPALLSLKTVSKEAFLRNCRQNSAGNHRQTWKTTTNSFTTAWRRTFRRHTWLIPPI